MRKLNPAELDRMSPAEFKRSTKRPFVFILDNIRSALNVGSVFRTADAFLFRGVYLCGITACPPHREILKTALGATESVPWKHYDDTLAAVSDLKKEGYRVVAVEQTTGSMDLRAFRPPPGTGTGTAFILGNEVGGIRNEVIQACDFAVEIPQSGTKHSLNVAVCAGIIGWDQVCKEHKKTP